MKMTYLQKDNHSRRRRNSPYGIAVFGGAVIVAILVIFRLIAPGVSIKIVATIAAPFNSITRAAGENTALVFRAITSSKNDLVYENKKLQDQVTLQSAALLDRKILLDENVSLKAMLNHPVKEKRIAAALITRPPFSPYDTFVLDLGSNSGIKVGDIVYAPNISISNDVGSSTSEVGTATSSATDTSNNIDLSGTATLSTTTTATSTVATTTKHKTTTLVEKAVSHTTVSTSTGVSSPLSSMKNVDSNLAVGVITEVFSNTSRVTLYSSSAQKNDVLIGQKNIPGVAEGLGGGGFRIKLPQNAGAEVGDTVTIAHFSPIVLGSIATVDGAPGDAFDYLYFKQPINVDRVEFVSVSISD